MPQSLYKMPESALELLTNKGDRERPFLDVIWGPTFGSVACFGAVMFVNMGLRRPIFSGVHRHIIGAVGGGIAGSWMYDKRAEHYATKDAQLRHYIELHPDSFPMDERKSYAETLDEWIPIR